MGAFLVTFLVQNYERKDTFFAFFEKEKTMKQSLFYLLLRQQ